MIRASRSIPASLAGLGLVLMLIPSVLRADGYRNLPEGAAAIGAFGGHRAFADDANATIHNAANLVDLQDPMLQLNVVGGYGQNTFTSAQGGFSDSTENRTFVLPGFSAAMPIQDGKAALGLAAYIPFGRSVDWGDDGFFAQNGIPYSGQMSVLDVTPNFALKLNDVLSLSIGADLYFGDVEQEVALVGMGLPAGARAKICADGQALGANATIRWKITENQRVAATVRSPFEIDYSGDNEVDFVGTVGVVGTIDYPTIVALAYGVELTEKLRLEADAEWLQFSRYEELAIVNSLGTATITEQDLEDTWTAGLGAEWDFAPAWTLRAGFMHLQNPTPDRTYSPLGPDEDQQVVSLGLGYAQGRHAVDLGYAVGIFNGRSIEDSANSPDGDYDYDLQVLSLSYGCKF